MTACHRHEGYPEDCWRDVWQGILLDKDGNIDLEQLKRELCDYSWLMHAVGVVYDAVTWGQASKSNTSPKVIIQLHEEVLQKAGEDAVREYREESMEKKVPS